MHLPVLDGVSVELENLMFSLYYEDSSLGFVLIPRMYLKGDSEEGSRIHLKGVLQPKDSVSFSRLAASFFSGGVNTVVVKGDPYALETLDENKLLQQFISDISGVYTPPLWVLRLLQGISFAVSVEPAVEGLAQELMKEVIIKGVDVDLSGGDTQRGDNPLIEAQVEAVYAFPPQFSIRHQVSTNAFIYLFVYLLFIYLFAVNLLLIYLFIVSLLSIYY